MARNLDRATDRASGWENVGARREPDGPKLKPDYSTYRDKNTMSKCCLAIGIDARPPTLGAGGSS